MISKSLMIVLLAFYVILMVAALYDNKLALALYWFSSCTINTAVLLMQ